MKPLKKGYVSTQEALDLAQGVRKEIKSQGGFPSKPTLSKDFFPAPVCHEAEFRLDFINNVAKRKGKTLQLLDGTVVASISRRTVVGLHDLDPHLPVKTRQNVLIKNPKAIRPSVTGLDFGETNVLISHNEPDGDTRLFMGVQTSKGIQVIRPVTLEYVHKLKSLLSKR